MSVTHFRVLHVHDDLTGLYVADLTPEEWANMSSQRRDEVVRDILADYVKNGGFRIVWVEETLPDGGGRLEP